MIDVPGAKPKRKAAAVKPRKEQKRSVGFTMVADAHMRLHRSDFVAWLVLMLCYARVRRIPGGRLDAGQCVCGSREIAARLGLDRGKVRRAIDGLVNDHGFITVDPKARGTIVTIPFVADGPVTTRNVGSDPRDQATRSRPSQRPTQVSTEPHHSTNGGDPHGPATRSRPAKRPLTETGETGETGVGAARNSINGRSGGEKIDELHAYLEKRRRRVLGKAYRALPRSAVARAIAERLAEGNSVKHCKLVVDADASEVAGGGKARHFGVNTFSPKNFACKLADAVQNDETRRAREREERAERDEQPPERRFLVDQRRLSGFVRFNDGATERDVLLARYDDFDRAFHKHKGTWSAVKRHGDRDDRTWKPRDEVE